MLLKVDHSVNHETHEAKNTHLNVIQTCPGELIQQIFSYLDLATLGASCCVSKEWKHLGSAPILWKMAIYQNIAFGSAQWAKYCQEDSMQQESRENELSSLPLDIVEYYKKYQHAFPEGKAKNDLMLVRLPKTLHGKLTLNSIGELGKRYFPSMAAEMNGWSGMRSQVIDELGEQSINQSYWVLMTKMIISETRGRNDVLQREILKTVLCCDFPRTTVCYYDFPRALEASVCFFAQCLSNKTGSHDNDSRCIYVNCQEMIKGQRVVVACRIPIGMPIVCLFNEVRTLAGVKALWRFENSASPS